MNPASHIIHKVGQGSSAKGFNLLSRWTGVHRTRVVRWGLPAERGGSDGVIPAQHHRKILIEARAAGIDLTPADFFVTDDEAGLPPVCQTRIRGADVIVLGMNGDGPAVFVNGEPASLETVKQKIRELERSAA